MSFPNVLIGNLIACRHPLKACGYDNHPTGKSAARDERECSCFHQLLVPGKTGQKIAGDKGAAYRHLQFPLPGILKSGNQNLGGSASAPEWIGDINMVEIKNPAPLGVHENRPVRTQGADKLAVFRIVLNLHKEMKRRCDQRPCSSRASTDSNAFYVFQQASEFFA